MLIRRCTMKKICLIVVLCAMIVLACACADNGAAPMDSAQDHVAEPSQTAQETTDNETAQQTPETAQARTVTAPDAQYIRTDDSADEMEKPRPAVIQSLDALYEYYQNQKTRFVLWTNEARYSDTTIGFIDAVQKYDAAFFEQNALVIVTKTEPSGSIRHRVSKAENEDGVLHMTIERLLPEFGTDDMADWLIITEVPKSMIDGDEVNVTCVDVPTNIEYPPPVLDGERVQVISGGVSVEPSETMLWLEDYDPETQERTSVDYKPVTLKDAADLLPTLTVAWDLLVKIAYGGYRAENVIFYDEALSEIETFDTLSVGVVM